MASSDKPLQVSRLQGQIGGVRQISGSEDPWRIRWHFERGRSSSPLHVPRADRRTPGDGRRKGRGSGVKTQGAPSNPPGSFLDSVFKEPDVLADYRGLERPSASLIPHSSTPVPRSSTAFPALRGTESHRRRAFPSRECDPGAVTGSIPHPSRSTSSSKRGDFTGERDACPELYNAHHQE
jgi:hypothetical protein